jgi:SRSO17 transposase
MYRNNEGYRDPTAGEALGRVMRKQKETQKKRDAGKGRKMVYVASRYAGDIPANKEAAVRCCRQVVREGYMPVASHLLYPQILDDSNPRERELGLAFGLALLGLCDEVWVYGEPSPGMEREIQEAKRLRKPVMHREVPA